MARKTEKGGKFRNVHCRTWNMGKNENHGKGEIHTLGLEIWRGKLKKVKS